MSAEPAVNANAENPQGPPRSLRFGPLARFLCLKLIRLMRRGSAARTVLWLLAGVCLTASFLVAAAARWKPPTRTAVPSVSPR